MRAVYKALARGQWEALQEDPCLIQQLQESVGRKHEGPLEYMARRGYEQGLKFVLSRDQNHVNEALVPACENGHLECVRILVEHGASPSAWNHRALKEACWNGHIEILKEFSPLPNILHFRLLRGAVHRDNIDMLTFLWDHDAECGEDHVKLVCSAVAAGRKQCLPFLLSKIWSVRILTAAIRGRIRWVWDMVWDLPLLITPSALSSLQDTAIRYRNDYAGAKLAQLERDRRNQEARLKHNRYMQEVKMENDKRVQDMNEFLSETAPHALSQ